MNLFTNVRKTLTGISAVTSFGGVVIGAIGVVMMVVGGRAILAGTMTLGDFIMYIFFVGMLAAPLIQMSSIGTQLSEALAGLDRIREIKAMATEDDEDAAREPLGVLDGRGRVRQRVVRIRRRACRSSRTYRSSRAAGTTTALVGSSGSGKSTLISLVMAFNHPRRGPGARGRARSRRRPAARLPAQLGVVLQDNFMFDGTVAENIRFSQARTRRMDEVKAVSRIAHCDEFVEQFPNKYDTDRGRARREALWRAAAARGDRAGDSGRPAHADSRRSDVEPRQRERGAHPGRPARAATRDGRRSSSRIGCRPSAAPTRFSCSRAATIVERGTHDELLAANGRYRQLHDKQYKIEKDRFVNPGEDFTPDLPKAVPEPTGGRAPVGIVR